MTSSASYCVATVLVCIATLAAVHDAQPLAQQDLQTLREYLLKQEQQTQPEIEQDQREIADDLANAEFADIPEDVNEAVRQVEDPSPFGEYNEVARQVEDPSPFGEYNEVARQVEDQPLGEYNERSVDDEESFLSQDERSLKDKERINSSSGARDKSGSKRPWYKRPESKDKAFGERVVVKAEKYRYGGNGPFYTDFGVVVTLENGSRLLIRKSVRCWGDRCTDVNIVPADSMTKTWELVASKELKTSTIGDFVEACRSAYSRNTAADAMMKLA